MDILNPPLLNIDGRIYCLYNSDRHHANCDNFSKNHADVLWEDEPSCDVDSSCTFVKNTPDGR